MITVGISIPDIQVPDTFDDRTFWCPVFKWFDFKWSGYSDALSSDHLKTNQNGTYFEQIVWFQMFGLKLKLMDSN